jgi:hypothetical protein
VIIKYREKKEIWEGTNKDTYKKIRELETKTSKCKIEIENWGVEWGKTWANLKHIKSLKKYSMIYKYLHGGWLTGDVAKRRRMIRTIPKCPLCKVGEYTKKHVILNCTKIREQREGIIREITIHGKGNFKESNLLFLDGDIKAEKYLVIINFILDIMKKCGQIIKISK